jgi:mono/diheme cytochrome c family protein
MFTRVIVALVALAVAFAILGADGQPVFKRAPPSPASAVDGRQVYDTYCAACHGKDGMGGGPASAALKVAVPDLTQLSAKNGGKFPELRVYDSIQGDPDMPAAHGSREMPIWGDVFQSMNPPGAAPPQMRLSKLTAYVRSLQAN